MKKSREAGEEIEDDGILDRKRVKRDEERVECECVEGEQVEDDGMQDKTEKGKEETGGKDESVGGGR